MRLEIEIAKNSNGETVDRETERRICIKAFLLGIAGSLIGLLVAAIVVAIYFDAAFLPDLLCDDKYPGRLCFYDNAWDSETYLSILTGFYGTIITILIGILGVVAAFAFFVIRGDAVRQSEEAIEEEIERYFSTVPAEKKVAAAIENIAKHSQSAFETELQKLKTSLSDLKIQLVEADVITDGQLEIDDEETTEETN